MGLFDSILEDAKTFASSSAESTFDKSAMLPILYTILITCLEQTEKDGVFNACLVNYVRGVK